MKIIAKQSIQHRSDNDCLAYHHNLRLKVVDYILPMVFVPKSMPQLVLLLLMVQENRLFHLFFYFLSALNYLCISAVLNHKFIVQSINPANRCIPIILLSGLILEQLLHSQSQVLQHFLDVVILDVLFTVAGRYRLFH